MNLEINGCIKVLLLGLLAAMPIFITAQEIDMFVDLNRFLDREGNTIYHINYKIPYNQITFTEIEEGFMATVDVKISAEAEDGEKTLLNEFAHYIGVRDKMAIFSETQYYLDKIELALSKEQTGLKLYIEFEDHLTGDIFLWSDVMHNLAPDALMSDLEFSSRIVREEPRAGFEKFRRGEYQFYVDPTHIYQRSLTDTICFYYEIQNTYPAVDEHTYITEQITIFNEKYSTTITNNYQGETTTFDLIHRIPADTLEIGYYQIEVSVLDRVTNGQSSVTDYFVISEQTIPALRLFPDIEKEYLLLRYFLPSSRMRNWDSFSDEAKRHFVDRFWTLNDPNPHSERNEFLDIVRDRIQHANQNFTHFRDGWETDRGRIYIRNGEPSEVERDVTDIDTKLTRKEYHIWRYRDLNRVYLFIDIQGTGNYRLIYSKNDDMEHTSSDWRRYLGEDFDMDKLQ